MLGLRLTFMALLVWFAVLFNVERLHEPINIASFVYVLAGALAPAIIMMPRLRDATYVELALLAVAVYVLLKWWLGYEFFGSHLSLTVTECLIVCLTSFLASRAASQIDDFLKSAGSVASIVQMRNVLSMQNGETKMYAEVQRSRRFHRPLAVAILKFSSRFDPGQWDHLSEKAKVEIALRYLECRVAERVSGATQAGDILVSDANQLIVMFPEGTRETVANLLQEISSSILQELGLAIQYGISQFPDEELTLAGLIDRAKRESLKGASPEGNASAFAQLNAAGSVPFQSSVTDSTMNAKRADGASQLGDSDPQQFSNYAS